MFSSFYAIVEKSAFAIGPGLIGLFLAAMGFIPTKGGQVVDQPDSAIAALYVSIAIIPALLLSASIILLLFYDLDENRLHRTGV